MSRHPGSGVHMPSFGGASAWINSDPLTPEELRGRTVLVNFWTLTCINWLRQEPYVRAWSRAYRDDGLVVIGVHTPEFSFEHDVGLVRAATARHEIDYSVAVDNEYAIWSAFANRYWPALYFIDADGLIRHEHFGEGRYEESETVIQRLLGMERAPVSAEGQGLEVAADWDNLRSPETYLGYARAESKTSPEQLVLNTWALAGAWSSDPESVTLDEPGGSIRARFHARDAHLVLAAGAGAKIPFRVLLDGEPPGDSRGVDVDEDGSGVLGDGRLYGLVRQRGPVLERTLEISVLEAGARAYAFTFG